MSEHVPEDTGSEESSDWAMEELQRCLKYHPVCDTSDKTPLLPSRVIDVGTAPARSNDPIRLVESKDLIDIKDRTETGNAEKRYVALSHHWGDPNLMSGKLTAKTLMEYKDEIPWSLLPRDSETPSPYRERLGLNTCGLIHSVLFRAMIQIP